MLAEPAIFDVTFVSSKRQERLGERIGALEQSFGSSGDFQQKGTDLGLF